MPRPEGGEHRDVVLDVLEHLERTREVDGEPGGVVDRRHDPGVGAAREAADRDRAGRRVRLDAGVRAPGPPARRPSHPRHSRARAPTPGRRAPTAARMASKRSQAIRVSGGTRRAEPAGRTIGTDVSGDLPHDPAAAPPEIDVRACSLDSLTASSLPRRRALVHGTFDPSHTRNRVMVALLASAGWEPGCCAATSGAPTGSPRCGGAGCASPCARVADLRTARRAGRGGAPARRRRVPVPGARRHAAAGADLEAASRAGGVRPARVPPRHGRLRPRDGARRASVAPRLVARRRPGGVRARGSRGGRHPRGRSLLRGPVRAATRSGSCRDLARYRHRPPRHPADGGELEGRVLFHGNFIPLHGIETIVRAAALLADTDLRGPHHRDRPATTGDRGVDPGARRRPGADARRPHAARAIGDEIRAASLCLGIFGTRRRPVGSFRSRCSSTWRCARPVVTGDTPAARHALGQDAVLVPPRATPPALAAAIRALMRDADRRRRARSAGRRPLRRPVLDRRPGRRAAGVARRAHRRAPGRRHDARSARVTETETTGPTGPATPAAATADRRETGADGACCVADPTRDLPGRIRPRLQSVGMASADEPARGSDRSTHYLDAYSSFDLTNATSISAGKGTMPGITVAAVGAAGKVLWSASRHLGLADDRYPFTDSHRGLVDRPGDHGVRQRAADRGALVGPARWINRRVATVAAVILAAEPFLIVHGARLTTDSLVTLFGAVGTFALAAALGIPRVETDVRRRRTLPSSPGSDSPARSPASCRSSRCCRSSPASWCSRRSGDRASNGASSSASSSRQRSAAW